MASPLRIDAVAIDFVTAAPIFRALPTISQCPDFCCIAMLVVKLDNEIRFTRHAHFWSLAKSFIASTFAVVQLLRNFIVVLSQT